MIAKATAREAGARFINLDASAIMSKWFGESQKLVSAVFTLARKIQPCIIFIDEIDTLLRSRGASDHEATSSMKGLFMQLWDGLQVEADCAVVVVGATNRPRDLDPAFRRRMPAAFHVGPPDRVQRVSILRKVLSMEAVAEDVDLARLSALTAGFSGSDLRELCRESSVYRVRELARESLSTATLRPIKNADLLKALAHMKESKALCDGSPLHTPLD